MSLEVLPLTEESFNLLDAYNQSRPHAVVMQSSNWARLQLAYGAKIALIREINSETSGSVFFIKQQTLGFGYTYWYVPKGPVATNQTESHQLIKNLEHLLINLDSKAIFLRLEPQGDFDIKKLVPTVDIQPKTTLLLNLRKTEDELLQAMHSKTRYNIRLASKKNLEYRVDGKVMSDFFSILEETRQRDRFRLHPRAYYEEMIKSGAAQLVTVWQADQLLAGALIAFYGDTATYLHGASTAQQRESMAPYFLHWQTIIRAQRQGYHWYDWHGIDEKKWPGVTRFKKGFGGEVCSYLGTFDLPLAPSLYRGYTIIRSLRRLLT